MGVIFARPDQDDRIIAVTPNPERELAEEGADSEEPPDAAGEPDAAGADTVASEEDSAQEGDQ
jgi:DNA gyrase subunit A